MTSARYASVARRIAAYLLDGVLAVVVLVALGVLPVLLTDQLAAGLVGYAGLLMLAIVQWCLLGTKGYTLGQLVLGIRVLDATSGEPIGMGRAFLRYLVLSACGAVLPLLVVVVVLLARDPRRQGWHDKAARSVVTEAVRTQRPAAPVPSPARPLVTAPSAPPAPPVLPVPPAPPAPPRSGPGQVPPPPGAVPVSEVDERTQAARRADQQWVLRPSTGGVVTVGGVIVAGRDPDAGRIEGAEPWRVDDPALTVSKTHSTFAVVDGSLWVEDLDSTHGVVIRRNGDEATLDARRPTRLLDGDVVVLGAFEVAVERG